ncbi:sugar phosphate isomerase/epimerase family protein [Vibrio viridaestus]|uniref:Sugar phosphate isomerase/epimerase n=1 Tax=Vibrio viridaestus TaxID=2487322 RepID=A0A3N9THY3_9VIBR|nr:sugar phosphate isomerase/epimerase family protein [Vibrio viridaestus]RQW63493.1 sugar phosphate isomerase/epimerase [Vibrio viridaestus]
MKLNQIGICSWTLGINDLDELMKKVKSLGLNSIQYCEPMERHNPEDVKQAAEKYGLDILVYDPFGYGPGGIYGDGNIESAITMYKDVVDYAHALGCGATLQGLSVWTKGCDSDKEAWDQLVRSVQVISDYALSKGVDLSYEPCNLYEVPFIHTADEYQKLVDETGCSEIAVLLDSFHMNIGERNPMKTLHEYSKRNSIFHISGANREGIAQGNLDFFAYHKGLEDGGFEGPFVFEFVLKGNPVNTPPRNDAEMEELSQQITQSLNIWKSYFTQQQ